MNVVTGIYAIGRSTYLGAYPCSYIIDKTPTIEPILALEHIEKMWTDACFIFCVRRGIDNVISKQRKWPDVPFRRHCAEWGQVIRAWDERKKQLRSPWIEIDFYNLENEPFAAAESLGTLLELTDDEVVQMADYLLTNRPAATSDSGKGDYITLEGTGWTDEQKAVFLELCGTAMDTRGYGHDEYWKQGKEDVEGTRPVHQKLGE